MLVVSDIHLGKARHFHNNGIHIPVQHDEVDLDRLSDLIDRHQPEKIVFLGDLFHSSINESWYQFQQFMMKYDAHQFTLVLGNHDVLAPNNYSGMEVVDCIEVDNIILTHEPLMIIPDEKYNIYGHIHPGVKLRGKGKSSIKLACYFLSKQYMILPAFGSFTGLYTMKPQSEDRIFITDGTFVKEVS